MTASSPAWWSGTIPQFLALDAGVIAGALAARAFVTHRTNEAEQMRAWIWQISHLRGGVKDLPNTCRIVLEYPLIRLGRRLDCVIVCAQALFVIEFKHSAAGFTSDARRQVQDYALDLRDFHAASRHAVIIPVLVSTGRAARPQRSLPLPGITDVIDCPAEGLAALFQDILPALRFATIDAARWETAAYRPVPSIIEAARSLYARHGVEDIRKARADTDNLGRTTAAILSAAAEARRERCFIAVFVTGIPGAGKTLCGLNAVFSGTLPSVFLTGTLPMVYVLSAALKQDDKNNARETGRATRGGLQSITHFLRHHGQNANEAPAERLIVFDEAQRAWDLEFGQAKFQHARSEAAMVLDIMERHGDYAVVVGLIGQGQEINTGEAGLAEWGRALAERPHWRVRAAPDALSPDRAARQRLFNTAPPQLRLDDALHLDVAVRNFRSQDAARWVDAVLRGAMAEAAGLARPELPFFVTRSQAAMRAALSARTMGQRRMGLVCSSGAKRLVAEGLWPRFEHMNEAVVANWFLKSWPDVRASDALEIPATEFACQGLELDYVGLCWDGDLIWQGEWVARRFRGDKWQIARGADARDYRLNSYRVLMTRARADTIIYVPAGSATDRTRAPEIFDEIARFLQRCGAHELKAPVAAETEDTVDSLIPSGG